MPPLAPPGRDADGERPDFHSVWVEALEQLELDVDRAEQLLCSGDLGHALAPWQPPAVRGPLPSDLEPRARLLLERQLAVAHRVTRRLTDTGRHQALTSRIRANQSPDVPVYLDLRA